MKPLMAEKEKNAESGASFAKPNLFRDLELKDFLLQSQQVIGYSLSEQLISLSGLLNQEENTFLKYQTVYNYLDVLHAVLRLLKGPTL